MAWNVDFTETAKKGLKKIDKKWQARILDYLEDYVAALDDPRTKGKALVGDKKRSLAKQSGRLPDYLRSTG